MTSHLSGSDVLRLRQALRHPPVLSPPPALSHCRHRESGRKWLTRGEEEDVMATSAECDGDGQLGGRSVAVVAAFAVVIVRRPPQGPSSHWQEATSEEEEDDGDE